ncbi:MAG: low-specificity L-threonine aldolase [Oligoflexales bacterium]|nr:low-specificity L-threonine aldolase [Oligoflexales bacterium]
MTNRKISQSNNVIDLRSDSITQPTSSMRKAMSEAVVGDDVFKEDPTVIDLECSVANLLGKEAGIFLPSGTMANLVSVLSHCQHGDEVLVGERSHIFESEQAGSSVFAGVKLHNLPNQANGSINIDVVLRAIEKWDIYNQRTRLLVLENTHSRAGGSVLPLSYLEELKKLKSQQLKLHLDGARLWHASIALDAPLASLVTAFDSVVVALSKGLAAPAGSILCGNLDFVHSARRWRKALGGGMRQVGVLAAAGLVAIKDMVMRLHEDHENAGIMAKQLSGLPGILLSSDRIETNIVHFKILNNFLNQQQFLESLRRRSILISEIGPKEFRLVTHYQFQKSQIPSVVNGIFEALCAQNIRTA